MEEIKMIENIEGTINSDQFKSILRNTWESTYNIDIISDLIGELYTINIINKDGSYYDYYMSNMISAYLDLYDNKISKDELDIIKAKLIYKIISLKLNINNLDDSTNSKDEIIKDYFIKEYVKEGYVTYSYHDKNKEEILKHGFTPGVPISDKDEIKNINLLFMELGLPAVMGEYPHFDKEGISLQHNLNQTFINAINTPEWFNKFTSSNHNKDYTNIEETPFILRSEKDCHNNVLNLCYNAGLNLTETVLVMNFYNKYYNQYSSPNLNVGFISKKYLKDSNIVEKDYSDLNAISVIINIIKEEEKIGIKNYNIYLNPYDIKRTSIPTADQYLNANNYKEESYDELYDPNLNSTLNNKIKQLYTKTYSNNEKVLKKVL